MYFTDATAGGRQNPATEIGADPGTNGATAVEVTYYSIFQHLRKLDAALPALNQPIYRKDKLGLAGDIHGQPSRIHLKIIAGDAETQKLVGRKTVELPLNKDGRSKTVYGQLNVLLPAKIACHAKQPSNEPFLAFDDTTGEERFRYRYYWYCIMSQESAICVNSTIGYIDFLESKKNIDVTSHSLRVLENSGFLVEVAPN